ncbi:PH domain-containing protein [Nesterenkonia rhizosphaerae]|uniref:PH domain-containing protein n=1 Tax=Nesterenkonia rhizosphaerae TaxID=1348272 RepID=A0ABP9G322_9MICC
MTTDAHTISAASAHENAGTVPSTPASSTLSLRLPEHKVERRAVGWWALQSFLLCAPVLAATIVAYVWWEAARSWLILAVIGAVMLLVVGVIVEPLWRYRVHRWETTAEAVYARSGWLVREWRAAPLSRVQTVDALRGPLEQLLGLSTLRVTTASSYGAIDIGGLDHQRAARLAQDLTEITQQIPGDAT